MTTYPALYRYQTIGCRSQGPLRRIGGMRYCCRCSRELRLKREAVHEHVAAMCTECGWYVAHKNGRCIYCLAKNLWSE